MENVTQKNEKSIPGVIKIDEKEVFDHLDTLVKQSVEDAINSLLDAEAPMSRNSPVPSARTWRMFPGLRDSRCSRRK